MAESRLFERLKTRDFVHCPMLLSGRSNTEHTPQLPVGCKLTESPPVEYIPSYLTDFFNVFYKIVQLNLYSLR